MPNGFAVIGGGSPVVIPTGAGSGGPVPAAVDYGTDFILVNGFTASFGLVGPNDPRIVIYGVYRRWTTDPASVAGVGIYQSQCRDIRQLFGSRFDDAILAGWEHDLAQVAKVDQRVDAAQVSLKPLDKVRLQLQATISVSAGPFKLIIPIDGNFLPQVTYGG